MQNASVAMPRSCTSQRVPRTRPRSTDEQEQREARFCLEGLADDQRDENPNTSKRDRSNDDDSFGGWEPHGLLVAVQSCGHTVRTHSSFRVHDVRPGKLRTGLRFEHATRDAPGFKCP